jgi:hypothetical protein
MSVPEPGVSGRRWSARRMRVASTARWRGPARPHDLRSRGVLRRDLIEAGSATSTSVTMDIAAARAGAASPPARPVRRPSRRGLRPGPQPDQLVERYVVGALSPDRVMEPRTVQARWCDRRTQGDRRLTIRLAVPQMAPFTISFAKAHRGFAHGEHRLGIVRRPHGQQVRARALRAIG